MRKIVEYLVYIMMILSSGAIIQLVKDGGAQSQGATNAVTYSGVLDYLPSLWQVAVVMVIALVYAKERLPFYQFDFAWSPLLVMCFASALWADYSKVSFSTAVLILLSYLIVNLHVVMCGVQKVLASLNSFFMCILILSLLTIFLLPNYGVSIGEHAGKWQGVFPHKNALGNFASMLYVFYIWWFTIERSTSKMFGIALSLLLVIGSTSSTATLNVAACTLFYILHRFPLINNRLYKFRFIIVGMCGVAICWLMLISVIGKEFYFMDKDLSFSNRNLVWGFLLNEIESSPWIGHGLNQFSVAVSLNDAKFLSQVGFIVGSAHNGFLECLHSLGLAGLSLTLGAIVQPLRSKVYGHHSELAFLFVIFFLIINAMESMLLWFNPYFIMLMYIASLTRAMSQQSVSEILA